jgi:predicted glycoside hydrolase/deacetylase ChbG (UPF0249 family)
LRHLIINADGYGFTEGITRAIEECVEFGTVRSLSANVNFPDADRLAALVRRHPNLSVGCHLNPVVGRPVLPADRVPSLVGDDGEFHYRSFAAKVRRGEIREAELRAELNAQIARTRALAGSAFSHVDFHMGLHRLPEIYPLFLEVAAASGTGRIRTHRYRVGMESGSPRLHHWAHLVRRPTKGAKYAWNLALRWMARRRGFAMPDSWVEITEMGSHPERINVDNYLRLLRNIRHGYHEFVAHPAYLDDVLNRHSTYLEPRVRERTVLLSEAFRGGLHTSGVRLAGYRDIPLRRLGREACAIAS